VDYYRPGTYSGFGKPIHKLIMYKPGYLYLYEDMTPDYPHKIFADRRMHYPLLMIALAMDTNESGL